MVRDLHSTRDPISALDANTCRDRGRHRLRVETPEEDGRCDVDRPRKIDGNAVDLSPGDRHG